MKLADRLSHAMLAFVAFALYAPSVSSAAQGAVPLTTTVPTLVTYTAADDGRLVTFSGEAIGEALRSDGDFVWVNVLEGGTAVGVHVHRDVADRIDGFGDWGRTGSIIDVVGTVNIACPEHEGDFDVHARELVVVEPSVPREHPLSPWKIPVAAAAGLTGAVLLGYLRTLRRREGMS